MAQDLKERNDIAVSCPIKGFQEITLTDWEGKVASIIFLGGCNFRCGFCHSSDLVMNHKSIPDIPFAGIEEFLKVKKTWVDGVEITGGEPTLYGKALLELTAHIRRLGFKVKLDTNGTNPFLIKKIIESNAVDYIAMDIKAPLNRKSYENAVSCDVNMENIIRSKDIILNSNLDYEFRTTVVPGIINESNILMMAADIKGAKKYCIQQFVPRDTLDKKYLSVKPYQAEVLEEMARKAGHYVKKVVLRAY
jgi:pyruvate formate lyase activating enzyme